MSRNDLQGTAKTGYDAHMLLPKPSRGLPIAMIALFFAAGGVWAEEGASVPSASLNSAQIVERMQHHNREREEALKHYQSVRHYKIEYTGFSKDIAAEMDVDVNFDAASGKSFRIASQSGSKFLCDKVLKRAIDSEKEASMDKGATALTPANYKFHLVGSESTRGRPAYVLDVEPLKPSKFLYRGKIWVDAEDFAVVKVDAQPSKSPSFWIARTLICFTNTKTGEFWLPEQTRSETSVRIGGTAVLTINYGTYRVVPHGITLASGR